MTSMGPLHQANAPQDYGMPTEAITPGFVMTRNAMAIIIMWAAAVTAGVGAWGAWGWGQGLFTFGIMIAVYGILLGISS
jgi:hypothetical protein